MIEMWGFSAFYTRLLVFAVLSGTHCLGLDWSYRTIDQWAGICSQGRKQSPINLQKDTAEYHTFNDFEFHGYRDLSEATEVNNGHSVAVTLNHPLLAPSITGAGLPYDYILNHLHFHWESEHTIHSNRFPLELHFVHYASKYNSTEAAMVEEGGLAVLGVLFDISEEDNPAFEPLLNNLNEVKDILNKEINLHKGIIPLHFLPKDTTTFFRYEGSLTTPPCDEVVIWTVFYKTNTISKRQLAEFQGISSHEGPLKRNYRSLQLLNDRVVTFRNAASLISRSLFQNTMILCFIFSVKYLVF